MILIFTSFFGAIALTGIDFDLSILNPIRNYKQWRKINWFGVIVGTILLNAILPLYAIIYWGYKLVTVGRNDDFYE